MPNAASNSSARTDLKSELYDLVTMIQGPPSMDMEGEPDDPIEVAGLTNDEISVLIQGYRDERDQLLVRYRRIYPALENDLLIVAKQNLEDRGAYGFFDTDLAEPLNAELGLDLYPLESLHKFCLLAGWQNRQHMETCTDCSGPYIDTLWIAPQY